MCPRAVAVVLFLSSTLDAVCDAIGAPTPPALPPAFPPTPGSQFSGYGFCRDQVFDLESECEPEESFKKCLAASILCDLVPGDVRMDGDCPPKFTCSSASERNLDLVTRGIRYCDKTLPKACVGDSLIESRGATENYEECITSFIECQGSERFILIERCNSNCLSKNPSLTGSENDCFLEPACSNPPPPNSTCEDGSSPESWNCELLGSACTLVPTCSKSDQKCKDLDEIGCGNEATCIKIIGYPPSEACSMSDSLSKLSGTFLGCRGKAKKCKSGRYYGKADPEASFSEASISFSLEAYAFDDSCLPKAFSVVDESLACPSPPLSPPQPPPPKFSCSDLDENQCDEYADCARVSLFTTLDACSFDFSQPEFFACREYQDGCTKIPSFFSQVAGEKVEIVAVSNNCDFEAFDATGVSYQLFNSTDACNCTEPDDSGNGGYRSGDVTTDGIIDVRDVVRLTPVLLGEPLSGGVDGLSFICTGVAGDSDGNGLVTVNDVVVQISNLELGSEMKQRR